MKRNLKTFGLALGAMLALGALLAAGASAQSFHAAEEDVILTGHSSNPAFRIGEESTTEGLTVTCETATYQGTSTGTPAEVTNEGEESEVRHGPFTTSEVTVHPIYEGTCETPVGGASINTNGCDYVLTSEEEEEHAKVAVVCTEGSVIEIKATGCTMKIGSVPENTLTQGVHYENLPNKEDPTTVTVDSTVDNIPFTSSGFLCGFAGIPKEGHNGFYEDDVVVEGRQDKGCTTDETHVLTCEEGNEVSISVE